MGVGGAQYRSLNSQKSNSNESSNEDIHDETELSSDSDHAM